MRKFAGILVIMLGIATSLMIGVSLLVSGISEIVRGFSAHPHSGSMIGWGAVKVFPLAEVSAGIALWASMVLGIAIIFDVVSPRPIRAARRKVANNIFDSFGI